VEETAVTVGRLFSPKGYRSGSEYFIKNDNLIGPEREYNYQIKKILNTAPT
jgi:hypothetical protein